MAEVASLRRRTGYTALACLLAAGLDSAAGPTDGGVRDSPVRVPVLRRAYEGGRRGRQLKGDISGNLETLGYYAANVCIGSPGSMHQLIIDTGSSMTAVPCATCTTCGRHKNPKYNPRQSQTSEPLGCKNPPYNMRCARCESTQCGYAVSYTEGSKIRGRVYTDHVHFGDGPRAFTERMVVGCQTYETGLFKGQVADGIMGISATRSGGLASPTPIDRLVEQRRIANTFSFCLADHSGQLVLGGTVRPERMAEVQWLPMRDQKFYSLALNDMQIGGVSFGARPRGGGGLSAARPALLSAGGGDEPGAPPSARGKRPGASAVQGGIQLSAPSARARLPPCAARTGVDRRAYSATIIDTGTTFLYLPPAAHRQLKAHFTGKCPWGPCASRKYRTRYDDEFCYSMGGSEPDQFGTLSLHFDGSARPLLLTPREYTYEIKAKGPLASGMAVRCLAAFDNQHNGVVLGAAVLRNHEVILDRANRRVGFVRTDCARAQPATSILANSTFLSDSCGGGGGLRLDARQQAAGGAPGKLTYHFAAGGATLANHSRGGA